MMSSNDKTRQMARWKPLLEKIGMPEDRHEFVVDYAEHYTNLYSTLSVHTNGNLNEGNFLPFTMLLFKELDLDGVEVLVTEGPALDIHTGDNLQRVVVGTVVLTEKNHPTGMATERALYLQAKEQLNAEFAEHRKSGKPFIFVVYALPLSANYNAGNTSIRLRYAIVEKKHAN